MWIEVTQASMPHCNYELYGVQSRGHWEASVLTAQSSVINHIVAWIASGLVTSKDEIQAVLEALYRSNTIKQILSRASLLSPFLSHKCMHHVINIMSELVLTSSKFLTQFVDVEGLEIIDNLPLFIFDRVKYFDQLDLEALDKAVIEENSRFRVEALISGLQIASQLARNSEQFYASLSKVFTAIKLAEILQHDHPIVRAKGCNLIGNLCRHSDRFYSVLGNALTRSKVTVLDLLADCCGDHDAATRKFASFAGEFDPAQF